MPTQLTTARHLDGLGQAMLAFVRHAEHAGLDAAVPTCPDWTVRDLVAHQGMVHRWAAAIVRGGRTSDEEAAAHEAAGRESADPLGWLREGAADLVRAVLAAPDDLDAFVFLDDAPAAREFWARRQCHETTMHAVDALAADLGRPPDPVEVWVDPELAGDGIDELLGGFLTRPRARLRCDDEAVLVVAPDDLDDWWEVALGPHPARTTRRTALVSDPDEADADWELTGSAVGLYLQLWNRADPAPEWQHLTAVTWS